MIANKFYLEQYGELARVKADGTFDIIKWAAFVVYILISLGIVFFALPKVDMNDAYSVALAWGFFFGLIIYGVFDYTNYSTMAKWPILMCLVDVVWGSVLCASLTAFGKYLRDVVF
jgi:uncharacterized membrane protein